MVRPSVLRHASEGAAAAEMALVAPLLLILLFGSVETGNYFLDQHVLTKAVRDGARYAARRDFADFTSCASSGEVAPDVEEKTENIIMSGSISAPATSPRVDNLSRDLIDVSCRSVLGYSGIYRGAEDGAPVVVVAASVEYKPLLAPAIFDFSKLKLNARSQAAVSGI